MHKDMYKTIVSELIEWVEHFLRWFPGKSGIKLRYFYYRSKLKRCGRSISFPTGCYIRECKNIVLGNTIYFGLHNQIYATGTGSESIIIGNNVHFNSNVMINADFRGHIEIGSHCLIGPNVVFRTSNHVFSDRDILILDQGYKAGAIIVEDNVWIGANVSVIGSIKIGSGAIVGAGTVVTKDVPDYAIVAGVPARQIGIRTIQEDDPSLK